MSPRSSHSHVCSLLLVQLMANTHTLHLRSLKARTRPSEAAPLMGFAKSGDQRKNEFALQGCWKLFITKLEFSDFTDLLPLPFGFVAGLSTTKASACIARTLRFMLCVVQAIIAFSFDLCASRPGRCQRQLLRLCSCDLLPTDT